MISFYCKQCKRFIKNEHDPVHQGMSLINDTLFFCEECNPPTPKGLHHSQRKYCKKGHVLDGVLQTKRDGNVRYCKICMAESDKKFKEKKKQERLHGKNA